MPPTPDPSSSASLNSDSTWLIDGENLTIKLLALREILRGVDLAQIPPGMAAAVAGDKEAVRQNNAHQRAVHVTRGKQPLHADVNIPAYDVTASSSSIPIMRADKRPRDTVQVTSFSPFRSHPLEPERVLATGLLFPETVPQSLSFANLETEVLCTPIESCTLPQQKESALVLVDHDSQFDHDAHLEQCPNAHAPITTSSLQLESLTPAQTLSPKDSLPPLPPKKDCKLKNVKVKQDLPIISSTPIATADPSDFFDVPLMYAESLVLADLIGIPAFNIPKSILDPILGQEPGYNKKQRLVAKDTGKGLVLQSGSGFAHPRAKAHVTAAGPSSSIFKRLGPVQTERYAGPVGDYGLIFDPATSDEVGSGSN